jgi:hypothetical protein
MKEHCDNCDRDTTWDTYPDEYDPTIIMARCDECGLEVEFKRI